MAFPDPTLLLPGSLQESLWPNTAVTITDALLHYTKDNRGTQAVLSLEVGLQAESPCFVYKQGYDLQGREGRLWLFAERLWQDSYDRE